MTTFRGAGAWGPGKGAKLTAAEIDANFYGIIQRLAALEGGTPNLNAIDNITFNGSSITILTERGETFGPWTLPLAVMRARGAWDSGVAYAVLDMVNVPGDGLYLVNVAHTSATTFDAARRIGTNDVYTQIMTPGAQGPKGDTGDTGATGATGAQGVQGIKGDTGDVGPTGSTGDTGAQGIQGIKGDPGTNFSPDAIGTFAGRSAHDSAAQWFSYLSTDGDGASITSAVIFFKNSGTSGDWSSATPFQGPKGDTGPQGAQGIKGDTGDPGPQGPAGTNGTNGSGVPAGGTTGQVLTKNSATDADVSWVNPASSGGSGHAFWRLFFTSSNSASYCSASEVEFLDNIGGSDMTTGGTPLSGPTYFGSGGTPAFDNDTGTRFAADTNGVADGTAWVGYHFTTAVEVRAFTIRSADGFSAEAPSGFKLQYSDTGADGSWVDAQTYTSSTAWGNLEQRSFVVTKYQLPIKAIKDIDLSTGASDGQALVYDAASGKFKPGTVASSGGGSGTETGEEPHRAHRGWRVFAINTIESPSYAGGGFFSIAGLKFFDRAGAQVATSGGDVHGFNMHSSYPASNAFDADTSSLASSDLALADGHRAAVGYLFSTAVDVGSVKLTAGTAYQSHMPRDFVVQYSDDLGATWETYGIFSDTATWTASEERTYTLATVGIKTIGGGSGSGDSSITKPLIGNFTLTSEGVSEGAVLETSAGGLRLRDPNSGAGNVNVLRYAYQAIPGSDWKVVAKIRRSAWIMFASWGIVMANSATGNAVLYGTKYDGLNIGRILFDAYNSYNSRFDITDDGGMPEVWLGVSYSGGTLVYSFGLAGDRLEDIASESTPWLTGIDRLGFGFNTNHSGRDWYRNNVELLSWKSVAI